MKNMTANNAKEKLEIAKVKLEVFTDMYNHFQYIFESEYQTEEYKNIAHELLDAIVAKIDPIDY